MKKTIVLVIILAVFFPLLAADGPSVPFNLVFNKLNENILTFTAKEPDLGTASESVEEASYVSFPSLLSQADYEQYSEAGSLSATIAAYWDVYGKGVTIYLTFGSGEYMLMNSDSSSESSMGYQAGYNYNVDIDTVRTGSINSDAGVEAATYKSGDRVYLVGSESGGVMPATGRVTGSATLNLKLPLPENDEMFVAGQYNGIITLNLIITE